MTAKIFMFLITVTAIYHTSTFAACLYQSGNKKGATSVGVIIFLALILLVI
jgi:hypothetical protein